MPSFTYTRLNQLLGLLELKKTGFRNNYFEFADLLNFFAVKGMECFIYRVSHET